MTALPGPARARYRTSGPVRRAILLAHVACAGTWLGMDVVLAVLVVVLLVGLLDTAGTAARSAIADGRPVPVGVLVYPPVVSAVALLVAMALAVFKPWGPIRRPTPVPR